MAYNWDESKYMSCIKMLADLINKETDVTKRCYLLKVLDNSKMAMDRFDSSIMPTKSNKQRMQEIYSDNIFFGRYYSLIDDFYDQLFPILDDFKDIENKLELIFDENFNLARLTGAYVTNEKALSLTAAFYHYFDEKLIPYFDEVYADRFNFLRFRATTDKQNAYTDVGYTLFIDEIRKNFINIGKTKEASKIYTMIHEYGHATKNLVNPKSCYSSDDGLFAEVDAIFPELVAMHENVGDFNPLYVAFLKYNNLITYFQFADYLTLQDLLIKRWKDNGMKIDSKLKSILDEDYEIDEELIEKIMNASILTEGTYVISYLVAMELLHIYKTDRTKALDLYNQFLKACDSSDLFPFMSNLVKINGHIVDEAKEIVREMKLQLKLAEKNGVVKR